MAITDTSRVERVVIVLDPATSKFKGAHEERLREIRDGDDILSAQYLPASSVSEQALASILPASASLLAQLQAATDVIAEKNARIDDLERQVTDLSAQLIAMSQGGSPVSTISNYQAREALKAAGLFAAVNHAVTQAGVDSRLYNAWEYAPTWRRDSAFLVDMARSLGLSNEQVDSLFAVALSI